MAVQYSITKSVCIVPGPDIQPPAKDVIIPINQANVKGEPGTGFEKRVRDGKDMGEFECGNCEYFDANRCNQPDMKANSAQPRAEDGRPIVDSEDCCEYVERVGRQDEDEKEADGRSS